MSGYIICATLYSDDFTRVCGPLVGLTCRLLHYAGDVSNEDLDEEEGEERSRTLRQRAERSHLIVWQVFTDS